MPRTVEEALQDKAALWMRSLLDLSLRNPLLNAKPGRGAVEIVAPQPTTMFDRLIQGEGRGRLTLVGSSEPDGSEHTRRAADPSGMPVGSHPRTPIGEVRIGVEEADLGKRLRGLRQRARLALSEQGVHTLYVTLGLLRWTDAHHPGRSFLAPLVLQPVDLGWDRGTGRFHLTPAEEDAGGNEVLRHQWRQLLRRDLPEWTGQGADPTAATLAEYLQQVAVAVRNHPGWGVEQRCLLGLFSFAKLVMCEDLDGQHDAIVRHPFLRALVGDPLGRPEPQPGFAGWGEATGGASGDSARVEVAPEHSVLDTDSSQEAVITAAKRGESFVLQGPPGTGKSQTIANIVAECLGDGRRVLFVSQKRAALDVVHARLKDQGLDAFCLQLHSHLANRREFAGAVQGALEAARRPLADARHGADQDRVLRLRDDLARQLDGYAAELHRPRGPAGLTAFAVATRLCALDPGPDVAFPFADVLQLSSDTWECIHAWVRALSGLPELWDAGTEHPWFGLTVDVSGPAAESGVTADMQAALDDAQAVEQAAQACTDLLGCGPAATWDRLAALQAVTRAVSVHPGAPSSWIAAHPSGAEARIASLQSAFRTGEERVAVLQRLCTPGAYALPLPGIRDALAGAMGSRFRPLRRPEEPGGWRRAAEGLLRLILEAVVVQEAAAALAEPLGCAVPATPEAAAAVLALTAAMAADPRPLLEWLDPSRGVALAARARERIEETRQRADIVGRLSARYEKPFFDIAVTEWLARFQGPYARPWRFLLARYRADMRQLRSLARGQRRDWADALADLEALHRVQSADARLRSLLEEDARLFGPRVRGGETDWAGILGALDATRHVLEAYGGHLPPRAAHLLCAGGADLRDALRHQDRLAGALHRFQEAAGRAAGDWELGGMGFEELIALRPVADDLRQAADAYDQLRHCLHPSVGTDLWACLGVLDDLSAHLAWETSLREGEPALRQEFGPLYAGRSTHWTALRHALDWADGCRMALEAYAADASRNAAARLADPNALRDAVQAAQRFEQAYAALLLRRQRVASLFAGDSPLAAGGSALPTLADWCAALRHRLASRSLMREWGRFQALEADGRALGLQGFVTAARQRELRAPQLPEALLRFLWSLWLEEAGRAAPVLARFVGAVHEASIQRFADVDQRTFAVRRERLVQRLCQERARFVIERRDPRAWECTRLQHEVTKKRLMAIRQIIKLAPRALLGLFPCVMASPLSVAQFCAPGGLAFDTVVFDEASQIPTEDAVGAILRAQQVVVAGDKHQLPPTRFFSAGLDADEDDAQGPDDGESAGGDAEPEDAIASDPSLRAAFAGTEAYASLLEECVGADIPAHGLLWHYRSRHEGLIAFSNARIYGWDLLTFPCAHQEAACRAVTLCHVAHGRYLRSGERSNPAEAQAVVACLEEMAQAEPSRHVGVVAFSRAQQAAIQDALEERRGQPGAEALRQLTDEDRPDDPFFVKNLETVQGDEREVILLSVGYGPDDRGAVGLNFGPLVRQGGLRRLNVAVTRAQEQVTVFTSLRQEHLSRARSEGLVGLRDYLAYAAGAFDLGSGGGGRAAPSPDALAELLAAELRALGYSVTTHVGRATYRVPVAVVEPGTGRYVLGIETDGPQYGAARTARDRERLRGAVLDRLGWSVHRVWALAWVRDRQGERQRLLAALEAAARARGLTLDILRTPPPPLQTRTQRTAAPQGAPWGAAQTERRDTAPGRVEMPPQPGTSGAPARPAAPPRAETEPTQPSADRAGARTTTAPASASRPAPPTPTAPEAGTLEPEPYAMAVLGQRGSGRPFTSAPLSALGAAVEVVTRVEAPVSTAVVLRRILEAWQVRPLPAHRERVDAAIRWAVDRRLVRPTGRFLWPYDRDVTVRPRFPVDEDTRRAPQEIAPAEAAAALLHCLVRRGPAGLPLLVSEVSRLFDLRAREEEVRDWLVPAIRGLSEQGRIADPTQSGVWVLVAG